MTNSGGEKKVLQFSRTCSLGEIRKRPLKIHGKAMSSAHRTRSAKPPPPLIALSEEKPLPDSLLRRLRRLDVEQLQIVELIADAIARGAL